MDEKTEEILNEEFKNVDPKHLKNLKKKMEYKKELGYIPDRYWSEEELSTETQTQ